MGDHPGRAGERPGEPLAVEREGLRPWPLRHLRDDAAHLAHAGLLVREQQVLVARVEVDQRAPLDLAQTGQREQQGQEALAQPVVVQPPLVLDRGGGEALVSITNLAKRP